MDHNHPVSTLFLELTPDKVLDAVEVAGLRATGRALALNSYENRVYDVEMEDGSHRVLKFYRPRRWSRDQLADEHRFLRELFDEGMQVAAPEILRPDAGCPTLGEVAGIFYASFPKVRGRQPQPDEVSPDQLHRIGRLLGRMHNVGAAAPAPHRPRFHTGLAEDADLLAQRFVPLELESRYRAAVAAIERAAAPLLTLPMQRIHGDCHLGNLIYTSAGPCFVDFDDFLTGPVLQDLWLLCTGDGPEERLRALCAGYQELRRFAPEEQAALRSPAIVEALRGLRMVRFAAWIARRYNDPAFPRAFPDFPEHGYWTAEVEDLEAQVRRLG